MQKYEQMGFHGFTTTEDCKRCKSGLSYTKATTSDLEIIIIIIIG